MLFRLMPVSYCDTIALFYILSACRRPLRSFPFAVAEISGRRLAVGPGGRHRALAVVSHFQPHPPPAPLLLLLLPLLVLPLLVLLLLVLLLLVSAFLMGSAIYAV